jgi:hypothetical protein
MMVAGDRDHGIGQEGAAPFLGSKVADRADSHPP